MMNNNLYACPCCKNKIIGELNDFEICIICNWQDDPVQFDDPDYAGGANKMSLNEARDAYKQGKKVE